MRKVDILILVTGVQLFGLYTILVGVIGEKKAVELEVTPIPNKIQDSSHSRYYGPSVNKIVIFVIDAFRVDFLFRNRMSFVSKILDDSNGCVYAAKVKSPTVTLPRIKALVSGDISTYWDFMYNFKSSEMTQDNFIWQAYHHSKTLLFYGDDTWVKLFPTQFKRKEGVSSFFVSDFTEVDNNVTRNLRRELSSWYNWDLMVLHYLGLDHIGHVHGPDSGLISTKLEEMDGIIGEIYDNLKKTKGRSVLIVCGDHGMANVGGHGGNTYPEVTTPLIVLSTDTMPKCTNQNWRNGELPIVDQVDIASTLSALWGLPFPSQTVGTVIPGVLGHLPIQSQLFTLYYNAVHYKKLLSKITFMGDQSKLLLKFNNTVAAHINYLDRGFPTEENVLLQYKNLLADMSEVCASATGEQNTLQLIGGITIVFQALAMICLKWDHSNQRQDGLFAAVGFFGVILCYWIQLGIWIPITVLEFIIIYLKLDFRRFWMPMPESLHSWITHGLLLLAPLFYFSSSFVEEEHYIRYYMWTTTLILFMVCVSGENRGPDLGDICVQVFIALLAHRIAIAWNQTGQKWTHLNDFVDFLKVHETLCVVIVLCSLASIVYLRRYKTCHTFMASIMLTTFVKFDSGWISYLTFGYIQNLTKLGYLVPVLEGFSTSRAGFGTRTCLTNAWILFSILLQRLYNIPLIALILLQVETASWLCDKLVNMRTRSITFLTMSFAVFFYQGNSNSIASVDVNSGYLGLDEYNEVLIGLLIFANTFSATILVFLSFLDYIGFDNDEKSLSRGRAEIEGFLEFLTRTNGFQVAIFSVVIFVFRHHLFVWSVFTPKLLYLIAFTVLNLVVMCSYSFATFSFVSVRFLDDRRE